MIKKCKGLFFLFWFIGLKPLILLIFKNRLTLYRYCKTNNEKFLDLNRVYDYDDNQFPSLEVAKYMIIITIRPTAQNDPKIILKTYDCMTQNTSYVNINVTAEADNEVSFMSDDAIEKTVKYMEENIK